MYPHYGILTYISNIPHKFRRFKFAIIPPCFAYQQYLWNIALQPSAGCYNVWADLRCSGCSPLGEKSLWNGTIAAFHHDFSPRGRTSFRKIPRVSKALKLCLDFFLSLWYLTGGSTVLVPSHLSNSKAIYTHVLPSNLTASRLGEILW